MFPLFFCTILFIGWMGNNVNGQMPYTSLNTAGGTNGYSVPTAFNGGPSNQNGAYSASNGAFSGQSYPSMTSQNGNPSTQNGAYSASNGAFSGQSYPSMSTLPSLPSATMTSQNGNPSTQNGAYSVSNGAFSGQSYPSMSTLPSLPSATMTSQNGNPSTQNGGFGAPNGPFPGPLYPSMSSLPSFPSAQNPMNNGLNPGLLTNGMPSMQFNIPSMSQLPPSVFPQLTSMHHRDQFTLQTPPTISVENMQNNVMSTLSHDDISGVQSIVLLTIQGNIDNIQFEHENRVNTSWTVNNDMINQSGLTQTIKTYTINEIKRIQTDAISQIQFQVEDAKRSAEMYKTLAQSWVKLSSDVAKNQIINQIPKIQRAIANIISILQVRVTFIADNASDNIDRSARDALTKSNGTTQFFNYPLATPSTSASTTPSAMPSTSTPTTNPNGYNGNYGTDQSNYYNNYYPTAQSAYPQYQQYPQYSQYAQSYPTYYQTAQQASYPTSQSYYQTYANTGASNTGMTGTPGTGSTPQYAGK